MFALTPDAHVAVSPTASRRETRLLGHSRCAIQGVFVSALVKELVEAGVHFGHRASRWNPKMRPYIYARKNLIHIIDVRETVRGLLRAKKYLTQISSQGSLVLFVGTKRQAADADRSRSRCAAACRTSTIAGSAARSPTSARFAAGSTASKSSKRSATTRQVRHVLEEDAVGPQSRISQDVPQPERHPHDEPAARVPGHRRSEEGKERGQRSPEAGRRHGRADRHRLRSGPGRSADSGQRRQHALDRADRQNAVPTRSLAGKNQAAVESQHAAEGAEVAMA